MSGYFAIPRDTWSSIIKAHKGKDISTTVTLLNVLAARVRYNGNHGNDLEIGQSWMGSDEIAEVIGTTRQKVRTSLKLLEMLTIIQSETNQRGTTVTFLNKRIFCSEQPEVNQTLTKHQQLTDSTNTNTTKEQTLFILKQEDVERLCLAYNASRQEMDVELRAMEEWIASPKNKKKIKMSFRFASNWMKRWEARPKPNAEIEAIKREMFKPHPTQKNWE